MDALRTGVARLAVSTRSLEALKLEDNYEMAIKVLAKAPTIASRSID